MRMLCADFGISCVDVLPSKPSSCHKCLLVTRTAGDAHVPVVCTSLL